MHKRNRLPVMEVMVDFIQKQEVPNLEKIVFVCVQHLLYTSLNLFEALIQLGAKPQNIFLIGKHYSTCQAVSEKLTSLDIQLQKLTSLKELGTYTPIFNQDVANMWKKVQQHTAQENFEAMVVLDDGGKCLEYITQGVLTELPVIGIEQTTAGLFNPAVLNLHVPFIDVAACAAKKHLESVMIVDAVLNKLSNVLPKNKKLSCGVAGIGVIGNAVAKKLLSLGHSVVLYDQQAEKINNFDNVTCADSLRDLIQTAEYIFGCTGRDITAQLNIEQLIMSDKTFISCTSEDKEFLSLLKYIEQTGREKTNRNPLHDIHFSLKNGAVIHIYKGGFPVNFDDTGESVPAINIQLTRGLLLGALIQGITSLTSLQNKQTKGRIMLDPCVQKIVVNKWREANNNQFPETLLSKFNDISWIIANSGGTFHNCSYFETIALKTDVDVMTQTADFLS